MEQSKQIKREGVFEDIFEPNAIAILTADLRLENGEYKPASYQHVEHSGKPVAGNDRVLAAQVLSNQYPDAYIITGSKDVGILKDTGHTLSGVYKNALIRKGLPNDKIIQEQVSYNTITQLAQIMKITLEKKWSKVVIVTSGYHTERVKLMIQHLPALNLPPEYDECVSKFLEKIADKTIQVSVLPADEILINKRKLSDKPNHYEKLYQTISEDKRYQKRLKAEQKGIQDLTSGSYQSKKDK